MRNDFKEGRRAGMKARDIQIAQKVDQYYAKKQSSEGVA